MRRDFYYSGVRLICWENILIYCQFSTSYHLAFANQLFSRLLGVAPFSIVANEYKFNVFQFLVNLLFAFALVTIGCQALFSDYKNTLHGKSVRMKTRTAIVVTFSELFLSMFVVASSIVGGACSFRSLVRIDAILKHIDGVLRQRVSFFKFTLVMCYVICHYLALIYVDLLSWYSLTPYFWSYAVCYIYDLVEIAVEAQFALIALNIQARFQRINEQLQNYFKRQERLCDFRHLASFQTDAFTFDVFRNLHWSLCDSIRIVNNAFGWQLLTSILCICVHIIVTPYFLLLDLFYPAAYGSADIGFLILQVIWIITHHIHLLLLIMPASAASFQAKQAMEIICRNLKWHQRLEETSKLETFVLQLKRHPVEFSACGLFNLRRSAITSLIGSVVTYLVILIQFQNSDKVFH